MIEDMEGLIPAYHDNDPYEVPVFPEREKCKSDDDFRLKIDTAKRHIEIDQKLIKRVNQDISIRTFICDKCKQEFSPNWTGFHWPHKLITITNGNIDIPTSAETKCTKCNASTYVAYPAYTAPKSQILLFHDEAYRKDNKHLIFSGVMCPKHHLSKLSDMVLNFKEAIGVTGRLHMKDIWNVKITTQDDFLEKVQQFCENLSGSSEVQFFCSMHEQQSPPPKGKAARKKYRRKRFLKAAIMLMQHEITLVTDTIGQPVLVFDKDDENQKWLSESVSALMCTLMFPYMTKLIKVPIVQTIDGGANAGSELADFICYIIARYIDGKQDVDPAWLGDVMYIAKRSDGATEATKRTTFPLDLYPLDRS